MKSKASNIRSINLQTFTNLQIKKPVNISVGKKMKYLIVNSTIEVNQKADLP